MVKKVERMKQGTKRIVLLSVTAAAILLSTGRQAQAACSGGPDVFTCFSEADYLAKVAELGYLTFEEGFENDVVWGSVRSSNRAPAITSQDVIWTANHDGNEISTSSGASFTGQWGIFDFQHGSATGTTSQCDVNMPPEHCFYHDGFTGTRLDGVPCYAVGGYIRTTTVGAKVELVLDDATQIDFGQLADTFHHFFGVIDTRGFNRFQFRELEGRIGQQLYIFGDDFILGCEARDELAADFGAYGVWHRDAGVWTKLASWDVGLAGLVDWAGGLAADFETNGLWSYNGLGWARIGTWDAGDSMAAWGYGLAVDFDTNGLWSYDGAGWSRIAGWNAEALASWAGGLAADFGTNGIWTHNGTNWTRIATWNAGNGGLSGWANGLAVDFDAYGLWSYNGTSWSKIDSRDVGAGGMSSWNNGLAVDFDSDGLWSRDTSGVWTKLTSSDPGNDLAGWTTDLAADFDTGGPSGLWVYGGAGWRRIATWEADNLTSVNLN